MCISLLQSFLSFRLNEEFYLVFEPLTIQSTAEPHFEQNNGISHQLYSNLYTCNNNEYLSSMCYFLCISDRFPFFQKH